jgi:hypothetical protein
VRSAGVSIGEALIPWYRCFVPLFYGRKEFFDDIRKDRDEHRKNQFLAATPERLAPERSSETELAKGIARRIKR